MLCTTTIPSGYVRDALVPVSTKDCCKQHHWGGRCGCPRNRAACSSEIDTVADAVVHEHRVHPTGSLILMIAQLNRWSVALMSGVDGRCVRNMHLEVILNFGLYNSIISFGMFRFG